MSTSMIHTPITRNLQQSPTEFGRLFAIVMMFALAGIELRSAAPEADENARISEAERSVKSMILSCSADNVHNVANAISGFENGHRTRVIGSVAEQKRARLWAAMVARCDELADPEFRPDNPKYKLPRWRTLWDARSDEKGQVNESDRRQIEKDQAAYHARNDEIRAQRTVLDVRMIGIRGLAMFCHDEVTLQGTAAPRLPGWLEQMIPSERTRTELLEWVKKETESRK
jgi:hypothetical protein